MPRHRDYLPHGVIPAVLLPFHDDLSIDEASYRAHLRDVASVRGISAITVNAHASEVASCTFDEQRRVLEISKEELGALPMVNGIYADGSLEAARIARMAEQGGASAARATRYRRWKRFWMRCPRSERSRIGARIRSNTSGRFACCSRVRSP